ncbi:[Fe-Fe] hydrogenase large subunit C-terminal domain-containing protein [Coprothermobacter platensis]|uniref:[Fe-Fe] hydrogenase large subunit C-terminal domain-containing protein n=1 Tax=Coprothermobacter platensis TaxID=108819 RepID=UPI0003601F65
MYYHSVTLDEEKCRGCTNCIKRCPAEAIRVRGGKARIIDELCIDCGECIRACPNHAKIAITDSWDLMDRFQYRIALPAPSLYGQFKNPDINRILTALLQIGFDDVFEVALGADIISHLTREEINRGDLKKPVISSSCPAVVRLVEIRFPSLLGNVLDLCTPMEASAMLAKDAAQKKTGLKREDIGVFFISPCGAKVTSVRRPIGVENSEVDGVFSLTSVYEKIASKVNHIEHPLPLSKASMVGVAWARSGGEAAGTMLENSIYVDGIQNVIKVLEEIELGKMEDLDFLEAMACVGGCVGGPLTVENNFVAQQRIKRLSERMQRESFVDKMTEQELVDEDKPDLERLRWSRSLERSNAMELSDDIGKALSMMQQIDEVLKTLPGLDCGSCGAPTCKTLAEDIVKGLATEYDCVFILKNKINDLAQELNNLAGKTPPVMGQERRKEL